MAFTPSLQRALRRLDCPPWTINGTPLNMIEPGSSEKYPGLRIDLCTRILKPQLLEKAKGWL